MQLEPQDYELGEDVTESFERPDKGSGLVVSVKLNREDADALLDVAEAADCTVAQVALQAIHEFLARSTTHASG